MSDLVDALLTTLLNHGAWALGGTLFLAALGLPLPASLLLVAAGAFAQQGALKASDLALAALTGAVLGDGVSYGVGRLGGAHLPAQLRASPAWARAGTLFARWGGWGVFLTRFALTPVALPVNLLAGSTGYAWARYLPAVLAGEATWVVMYGGAGYLFAQQWETVAALAADGVGLLLGLALAVAAAFWLWRQRPPARR